MYEHLPRDATGNCDAVVWDAMDQEHAETQHQQHDTDAAMLLERTEEKMVRENTFQFVSFSYSCDFFGAFCVSMFRFLVFFNDFDGYWVCIFHT